MDKKNEEVYFNSNLKIMNSLLITNDNNTSMSQFNVNNDVRVTNDVYIGGKLSVNDTLYANSNVQIKEILSVNGESKFEGEVTLENTLYANNNVQIKETLSVNNIETNDIIETNENRNSKINTLLTFSKFIAEIDVLQ